MELSNNYPKYDIRRVRELTEDELTHELSVTILPYCWTVGGSPKPHDEDLEIIAGVIAKDLKDELNEYQSMFVEEVKRAFWDGAKGVFDTFYGMNIKSLEGFLMKYRGSDREKKLHRLVADEAAKWGPKQIGEGKRTLTEGEMYAIVYPQIQAMVAAIKGGATRYTLFCLPGNWATKRDDNKNILNEVERAKAYVRYSRDHDLWEEAEFLDREFRRMGLYAAI